MIVCLCPAIVRSYCWLICDVAVAYVRDDQTESARPRARAYQYPVIGSIHPPPLPSTEDTQRGSGPGVPTLDRRNEIFRFEAKKDDTKGEKVVVGAVVMECWNHCAIGRLMAQWFQQNNHTSVSISYSLIGRYEHEPSPLLILQDNA